MKTIVCFGDSNTWGYTPETGFRYAYEERWPGVLQGQLATHVRVIEEGLNGRTTAFDEPFRSGRDGSEALPSILESHRPLDLLIIALGANDLQPLYNASGYDSARGLEKLIQILKRNDAGPESSAPEILVIAPTRFNPSCEVVKRLLPGAETKFSTLLEEYRKVTEANACHYFDSNEVMVVSEVDGVHIDAPNHRKLGMAVTDKVKSIFRL
ncbi:MAG TPA: hydrolase [Nitrospirales bacterium]|nr:hydrolase [Nitrospirales bacterium]HIC04859.1 hydrolase [Nitrospirales bacterium]HIN32341.1 hydrolase [Nitrospirales bacterium]